MYAHEYGKKYFKHKTPFDDLVVFSDNELKSDYITPSIESQNTYIRVHENFENSGKWFVDFEDKLAGEYGDFYIEDNSDSIQGVIDSNEIRFITNEENDSIFRENIIDLQDGEVTYAEINDKLYIILNASIQLEEIVIKSKARKRTLRTAERDFDGAINRTIEQKNNIDYKTFVSFFISDDGATLERAYQKIDQVNDNELILFIETNEGTNLFGTVFRLKVGKNVETVIDANFQRMAQIARAFKVDVQSAELSKIVRQEVRDRDNLFYAIFRAVGGTVIRIVTWPVTEIVVPILGLVSDGLKEVSDAIDSLKFGENWWKATNGGEENPDYDPLLPGYKVLQAFSAEGIVKLADEKIFGPLLKEAEDAQKLINKYPKIKSFLNIDISGLISFLKAAPSTLGDILEFVNSMAKYIFQYINGLIVGLLNSIIDFIKSIFDILKMIVDVAKAILEGSVDFAKHPVSYMSMVGEVLENFIDILINTFTVKNFKEFISFLGYSISKGIESISIAGGNLISGKSLFPAGTVGYYTGYIVGFIISEILTAIATGGSANIAKGLSKFFASVKSMANAAKAFTKQAGKGISKIFSLETFLTLLKKFLEFSKNIPKLFKELRKVIDGFVDDLKSIVNKLFDELFPPNSKVRKSLDKNGYKITKYEDDLVSLCPI